MKFTFYFLITFFVTTSVYSQQLGEYKYIIVPEQFQFLKEPNQYGLNVATKQQLDKYGFKAYIGNKNLPFSIKDNICNILNLKAESNSNFLKTKIKFVLEDCEGKIVYISNEGTSKEKEYRKTYAEAFKRALVSFKDLTIKKSESSEESSKDISVISKENFGSTEEVIKKQPQKDNAVSITRKIVASRPNLKSLSNNGEVTYKSTDGFYNMIQKGNTLTFFEGQNNLGDVKAIANTQFPVETSDFTGIGYFSEGTLIVERIVKGVGKVKMKFIKE